MIGSQQPITLSICQKYHPEYLKQAIPYAFPQWYTDWCRQRNQFIHKAISMRNAETINSNTTHELDNNPWKGQLFGPDAVLCIAIINNQIAYRTRKSQYSWLASNNNIYDPTTYTFVPLTQNPIIIRTDTQTVTITQIQ